MELHVEGMTCDGCANAVRRSVAKVAPAATVSVELASGKVAIKGDADRAAVVAAIERAGYTVAA